MLRKGSGVIVCQRGAGVSGKTKAVCACGDPCVFLCDFPDSGGTCSKPLCHKCRRPVTKGVDYCPDHWTRSREALARLQDRKA